MTLTPTPGPTVGGIDTQALTSAIIAVISAVTALVVAITHLLYRIRHPDAPCEDKTPGVPPKLP